MLRPGLKTNAIGGADGGINSSGCVKNKENTSVFEGFSGKEMRGWIGCWGSWG
jgi:hypothetical protein